MSFTFYAFKSLGSSLSSGEGLYPFIERSGTRLRLSNGTASVTITDPSGFLRELMQVAGPGDGSHGRNDRVATQLGASGGWSEFSITRAGSTGIVTLGTMLVLSGGQVIPFVEAIAPLFSDTVIGTYPGLIQKA